MGLGTAGATSACLLADRGVDVVVLEREGDPRAAGAGIWLQAMGQRVLDRLGLLTPLRTVSREVTRVDIRTATGRPVLDLSYADVPGETPALGVHRGDLFVLLHDAVRARGVPVELDVTVTGVRPGAAGTTVETTDGPRGPFDLVIGADGGRSVVREAMAVVVRDHVYDFGALWSIVDDPLELAGDRLYQCLRGTRDYLGVLPTGRGRASIFWSVRSGEMAPVVERGLAAWRSTALPLAHDLGPLVDRVDHLLPARYRDVVVRTPYRLADARGRSGAVLVGDAAHAMSPQLGTGTSLALADALTLDHCLRGAPDLASALSSYAAARRAHVRWYQWWTRLMMPVFQSGLTPLSWPRDALAPWVARVPGMTPQLVTTLTGDRESPWRRWPLPT